MKFIVNKENTIPKKDRAIIKCDKCGFKYYDGDTHTCQSVSVEKEVKVRKVPIKTSKESFKIWKDTKDS